MSSSTSSASPIAQVRHGGHPDPEGEPGQAFLILITGEAEVTQGGKSLRRLYPGDDAGGMALLGASAYATRHARRGG
jgi:hypothetical protein